MIHDYVIFFGVFAIFAFLAVCIYFFSQNQRLKIKNIQVTENAKLLEKRLNEVQLEQI